MENERILSITKGPLLESVVGNTSSIHDLSDYHIVEILVRLPVKTIIGCKCVCRDWLNLITDSPFINLHLTKSPESFMLLDGQYTMHPMPKPKYLRLLEIQEEHGHNHLHHNPIMLLDLNLAPVFQDSRPFAVGSVNGLICLIASGYESVMIFICNPITREYMILPKQIDRKEGKIENCYGFGVSSLTGEYKVIRFFKDVGLSIRVQYAEIYTLGSGKWRSLTPCHVTYSIYGRRGTFLNNHLHWNICDYEDPYNNICRFDVDKETFDLLPSSPIVGLEEDEYFNLGVRNGCLCFSYYARASREVSIWVMKEYGIKNSWQKEVLISERIFRNIFFLSLQESFKDGSILMNGGGKLWVYRPYTNTIEKTQFSCGDAISYRPSFVKLQNFESENVHKFSR